jgi:hypothetical protein
MNHEILHRQQVSRLIYALWTSHGSDDSGLASPLLDSRIDELGIYVSFADDDDEEGGIDTDGLQASSGGDSDQPRTVDHCSYIDLTYEDFRDLYMIPNKPVIIEGLTKTWKSRRKWVDSNGEPDLLALASLFGDDVAPVHVHSQAGFTRTRPHTEEWTINDYALWWYEHHDGEDSTEGEEQQQLLYLKDYKFVAVHPDYKAYEWPIYFRDDWLNGYTGNAYKFVYLGPKGTSTRLHADVLQSYSWSTNVCGVKRWYLIPPEYTHLLYDVFAQQLASDLHCDDTTMYPGLAKARMHALEIIQQPGETIFVPSGWHHTVENLAPTLSINHNWLNGANVRWSWEKLRVELEGLEHTKEKTGETLTDDDAKENQNGSGDASQVGDDLLLLWLIISKNARSILSQPSRCDEGSTTKFDLCACLPILKEICLLVNEGKDQGLTERCHCDIGDLIRDVEDCLAQCT